MTDLPMDHDVENDAHRAGCGACQALWAELEAIAAEAKQLPTLTPSRDLWSGIEARITAPGAAAPVPAQAAGLRALPASPMPRRQVLRLAVAAGVLMAVTAGVTWRLATAPSAAPAATLATDTDGSEGRDGTDAVRDAGLPDDAATASLAALAGSVSEMDREIAALQSILRERRGELDPRTIDVLERNLTLIDTAIAEARAALEADPASQFLAQQFTRAYTSKLTLLRGAAQLPAGI
jgi:hypothetical protein